ncbi:MAG: DegT/DnrJ/EryC1/StrS family aminotransferase [Chthoniobacteraceae bacterium]
MRPEFPFQPIAEYRADKDAIDAAVLRVFESGHYILGPETSAFEKEFAAWVAGENNAHAVGVANGTDALVLAMRALGIGAGDTVLTVSHTAVATVAAIELTGAEPLLVDIDPGTFTLDPQKLADTIRAHPQRNFKAVIPVHLYGQAADMPAIMGLARQHGLRVIEDCAQSHGAAIAGKTTGTFGDAATFSFYPTKNLGAIGDGGAVFTHDAAIATRVHELRQYGWKSRYISDTTGMNSRLDELQAAILRAKLPHLSADNQRRRDLAALYAKHIRNSAVTLPPVRAGAEHVYHQYVVRSPHRDALMAALKTQGVPTAIHYPQPVHTQPAYLGRVAIGASGLGESERACREVLSLPMHPQITDDAALFAAEKISQWQP